MKIRKYRPGEEKYIWEIFYNTIHTINVVDYSKAQIEAWAPSNLKESVWSEKIIKINPYVIVLHSEIVAYADLQDHGYIDHFFCHHKFQRRGIGSFLYSQLEQTAQSKHIEILGADVSITAKSFFRSKGFAVKEKQVLSMRGQELTNFKMTKKLALTD